jgi:hypothetical protein
MEVMHVHPTDGEPVRTDTDRSACFIEVSSETPLQPIRTSAPDAPRRDTVDMLDARRSQLLRADSAERAALDPALAARIRGRLLSGAYDDPSVMFVTARRLLESGDL